MVKYSNIKLTPIEKGEEEMTTDYAIEWVKNSMCVSYGIADERCIAGKMAIEALEKADKYKWHDLQDNPEDLPEEGSSIFYAFIFSYDDGDGDVIYNDCKYFDGFFQGDSQLKYVGWKYIEPFEDSKQRIKHADEKGNSDLLMPAT